MPSAADAGTALIRVIVDLNVVVSALLGSSTCRLLFSAIAEGTLTPVFSPQLLADLRAVLARPKFRSTVSPAMIEELLHLLESHALVLTPRHHVSISRDPDDDHLFSLAIAGAAVAIVSGDVDVLSVSPISGLRVFSPRAFLGWLKKN